MSAPSETPARATDRRFTGIARLLGDEALGRLRRAHVMLTGVGGVGSWIAESLARSGVGELTLIDLDDLCESNINRQIHALEDTVGRGKARVMAERIRAISPETRVHVEETFFTAANATAFLDRRPDYFVDAIDSGRIKALTIALCKERGLPVLTVGGAGGRVRPDLVQTADLGRAYNDTLLARVRRVLRQEHGFPRRDKAKFGVPCVFSPELPADPRERLACAPTGLPEGESPPPAPLRLDCATGYGTASFVTGVFAFHAAAVVVRRLAGAK